MAVVREQYAYLAVGLDLCPLDVADIEYAVEPEVGKDVVYAQPQLVDGALDKLPIFYDKHGVARQHPAEGDVLLRDRGDDHLGGHKRQYRHYAVTERYVDILDRDRSHSRNKDGYDKLAGLKLSDLPFAHKAYGEYDDKV